MFVAMSFQPRKWPNLPLKSPGIQPKEDNVESTIPTQSEDSEIRKTTKCILTDCILPVYEDEVTSTPDSSSNSTPASPSVSNVSDHFEEATEEWSALQLAQLKQAPDAPVLLPRKAPPPLDKPPRCLKHFSLSFSRVRPSEQIFNLEKTSASTIMVRRSSKK